MKAVMEITSFDKRGLRIGAMPVQVDRRLVRLTKRGYMPTYTCKKLYEALAQMDKRGGAIKLEFRLV